jgi:hypothetical protein
MAKWKQGDILILPDNDLIKGIKILDVSANQYLTSSLIVVLRKIVSIKEIDSLPYTLYKGLKNGNKKNPITDNQKGTTQTRRSKTNRHIPKENSSQYNRRTIGDSKANGGRTPLHRKPRTSRWWKNKKKGKCDPPINGTH